MRSRFLILLALGVAVLAVAVGLFWSGSRTPSAAAPPPVTPLAVAAAPTPTPSAAAPARASVAAVPASASSAAVLSAIRELLAKLRSGQHQPEDLANLRRLIFAADPRQAMAAIGEFLKGGEDAPTGQGFTVAAGGSLSASPSLRVFLMDLLGQLSKATGSDAAATVARGILETKTTPEEWAVSLRNVAWSDPSATGYLAAKMHEMLGEPSWTANPSGALLESFDVIVFSGDPTFVPTLADLASNGSAPLQRAAVVALDRLAETSPLAVMSYLNDHPDTLADRPMFRADYFAKAELNQPAQQAAVESYLDRPDVSDAEKTKLIKALATPASFVSNGLVTTPPAPDDGTARQQAFAAVLQQWVTSNRFPSLQAPMQQVLARLHP